MNKLFLNTLIIFSFHSSLLSQNIPKVPQSIKFDNMVLNIDSDIITTIQNEVDAIHANDKYFQIYIDRINIYFPFIEEIIKEEGMPEDIKYLSIQESALISDAVSSSNAVGFWQFKSETAKDYNLIVNSNIDERKNIISSTKAACRYIKNSNYIFENWIFSILSYQQGLNGAKALVDPKLYGAKRMTIDIDTHWYIIKFLAHKVAFQDHIDKSNYDMSYSIYNNKSFKSVSELKKNLSINDDKFMKLNKWINSDKIPNDRVFSFLIPEQTESLLKKITSSISNKVESFIENNYRSSIDQKILNVLSRRTIILNNIPAVIVEDNDELDDIIKLYDISKNTFLNFNDINENHDLMSGLPYYLKKKKRKANIEFYIRNEEEDLWRISQMFGVQMKNLIKYNKKNKSNKIVLRRRFTL